MIRLADIWKTYTTGTQELHALREVNEHIRPGEHVAIMGPSGSGKSTLLNILGCLDQPTRGSYELEGRGIAHLPPDELAQVRLHGIGFVFQAFHLVPRLDALQNVTLPMIFAGIPTAERKRRAQEALESVGLVDWSHHRPAELSGGQKQRVAIARSIVMRPRLMLADEPTGNLDTASGTKVLELLSGLNREGITLIMVTHDPAVGRLADRILVLTDGTITARVPGREIAKLNWLFSGESEESAQTGAAGEPARSEPAADAASETVKTEA